MDGQGEKAAYDLGDRPRWNEETASDVGGLIKTELEPQTLEQEKYWKERFQEEKERYLRENKDLLD